MKPYFEVTDISLFEFYLELISQPSHQTTVGICHKFIPHCLTSMQIANCITQIVKSNLVHGMETNTWVKKTILIRVIPPYQERHIMCARCHGAHENDTDIKHFGKLVS